MYYMRSLYASISQAEEIDKTEIPNAEISSPTTDASVSASRAKIPTDGPENQPDIVAEFTDVPNLHVGLDVCIASFSFNESVLISARFLRSLLLQMTSL